MSIRYWAHRGGGSSAPENSLAGLRAAAAAGFQAVEFDVLSMADGCMVVHHDEQIGRVAHWRQGAPARTARGELARLDHDIAALTQADLSWLSLGEEESLPHLEDYLDLAKALGLVVNIELKDDEILQVNEQATEQQHTKRGPLWRAQAKALMAHLHGGRVLPGVVVSSFAWPQLQALRDHGFAGELALLLHTPDVLAHAELASETAQRLQASALHVHAEPWLRKLPDQPQQMLDALTCLQNLGLPLRAYTVNDSAEAARLFAMGFESVFTDDLRLPANQHGWLAD